MWWSSWWQGWGWGWGWWWWWWWWGGGWWGGGGRGWVDSVLANFIAETAIHGAVAVLGSAQSFSSDASLTMFAMPPPWLFGVLFEVFLSPWYSLIFIDILDAFDAFLFLLYFEPWIFSHRDAAKHRSSGDLRCRRLPGGFDLPHEKIWDQPWDLNGTRPGKHTKSWWTNHLFLWVNPLSMAIFNRYVSLPEGKCYPLKKVFNSRDYSARVDISKMSRGLKVDISNYFMGWNNKRNWGGTTL